MCVARAPAPLARAGFAGIVFGWPAETRGAVGRVLAVPSSMTTSFCLRLLGIGLVALSCAGSPKRPETASARMKDSAPEKIAAQRAAGPHGAQLEQDDDRWGFEAARERRRADQINRAQTTKQPAGGDKSVDVTNPPAR
jgi:hypothetical protein